MLAKDIDRVQYIGELYGQKLRIQLLDRNYLKYLKNYPSLLGKI
jgi:hypothetical protein